MEETFYQQLATYIYQKMGMDYRQKLPTLKMKIAERFQSTGCPSEEYISYLTNHPSEMQHLIQALTINETYFYREEKQMHALQNILETYKTKANISIWSAACSTGEEPYTILMSAYEQSFEIAKKIRVTATDIDQAVLNSAKKGEYNKNSLAFRRIPISWVQKYFIESATSYSVATYLKNQVQFENRNLVNLASSPEKYDVIFCRNVLIYFDQQTIEKVIGALSKRLKIGGYLFLGHAERLPNKYKELKIINNNGTFYYRKEE